MRELQSGRLEPSMKRKRRGYLYVNNRLEGCAPLTIDGILLRNFDGARRT
jgi:hypothetical protein